MHKEGFTKEIKYHTIYDWKFPFIDTNRFVWSIKAIDIVPVIYVLLCVCKMLFFLKIIRIMLSYLIGKIS